MSLRMSTGGAPLTRRLFLCRSWTHFCKSCQTTLALKGIMCGGIGTYLGYFVAIFLAQACNVLNLVVILYSFAHVVLLVPARLCALVQRAISRPLLRSITT